MAFNPSVWGPFSHASRAPPGNASQCVVTFPRLREEETPVAPAPGAALLLPVLLYVLCELRRPFPPEKDAVLRKLQGHVTRVVSQGDRRPEKIFLEVDKKKVTLTSVGTCLPAHSYFLNACLQPWKRAGERKVSKE